MARLNKPESEDRGNDVLRGIERWLPSATTRVPKAFKYKSASGIYYKSELEESLMLQRAGNPEWENATAPRETQSQETQSQETQSQGEAPEATEA